MAIGLTVTRPTGVTEGITREAPLHPARRRRPRAPPSLYILAGGFWDGSHFGDTFFAFPAEMGIAGSFGIIGFRNVQLPRRLWVERDFSLIHCPNVSALPAELFVGGNLFIKDTPVGNIPNSARVLGRVIRVPATA